MGVKRPFGGFVTDELSPEISEGDDVSSDDSIEVDPGPENTQSQADSNQKYGIGAMLLEKMGYSSGSGLGADGSGMLAPIEVEKRQKRAGLGMANAAPPSPPPKNRDTSTEYASNISSNSKVAHLNVVKSELASIRHEQDVLMHALQIIESKGSDLDVTKFYHMFGRESVWYNERLYEVIGAVISSRIPDTNAFTWLNSHPDVLLTANQVLPEDTWGHILAEKWLYGDPPNVMNILNQWIQGRSSGFAAAGPFISRMFGDNKITRISVAQGYDFIIKLLNVLPDPTYFVSELKRSIGNYSLNDQSTILAAIPFETSVIAKIVSSANTLTARADILQTFAQSLTLDVLSDVLSKTYILEQWVDQLSNLLRSTSATKYVDVKLWWEKWQPFFSIFDEQSVDPWLAASLDAINAELDGTPRSYPIHATKAHVGISSTLKDVLSHFCYMNELTMTATPTGFKVAGMKKKLELMVDNDVLLVRHSHSLTPVSLNTLQAYLSNT